MPENIKNIFGVKTIHSFGVVDTVKVDRTYYRDATVEDISISDADEESWEVKPSDYCAKT